MLSMNKIRLLSAFCVGFTTVTHAEMSFEQELKQGCSKLKSYANQGKKFYDQKQYAKAIDQFEQQASWTAFCLFNQDESGTKLSERDVELAYNNVGLSYAKLGKPAWALAWFSVFSDAKSSQFNLKQLPAATNDQNIAGKYIQHAGFGTWNTLIVKQTKKNYSIEYEGLYMGIRSLIYGPNLGSFETTMPLGKTQKTYKQDDCTIDLSFGFDAKLGHRAVLKQNSGDSGCGFGHNVSADGLFIKVE